MTATTPPIDILRRARDVLTATGFEVVRLRPLPAGEEGVVIRPVPPTTVKTYMDGTQQVAYLMDVYCRFEGEDRAIDAAYVASQALQADGLPSANGSYQCSGVTEYSGAVMAEEPRGDLFTYSVGMRADITTT